MSANKAIRESFSLALIDGLVLRYKEIPSAAFIAKEFNLRALGCDEVSQETVRRWLRGLTIPEFDKLVILQFWLKIDLNSLGACVTHTQEKTDTAILKEAAANLDQFIKTTNLVSGTLQELMREVDRLKEKLENANLN